MKKTLSILACALLLTGCGILATQPYINTYFFDIGSPQTSIQSNNFELEIMSFDTSGPFREKMVFRTTPNSVRFDEFNRWSMPPEVMFKRYLLMIYDSGDDNKPTVLKRYALKGEIVQLEADLQNKKANLAIRFELYETKTGDNIWTQTFKQQIPTQTVTGESFAAAVKYGTDNIVKDLNVRLKNSTK